MFASGEPVWGSSPTWVSNCTLTKYAVMYRTLSQQRHEAAVQDFAKQRHRSNIGLLLTANCSRSTTNAYELFGFDHEHICAENGRQYHSALRFWDPVCSNCPILACWRSHAPLFKCLLRPSRRINPMGCQDCSIEFDMCNTFTLVHFSKPTAWVFWISTSLHVCIFTTKYLHAYTCCNAELQECRHVEMQKGRNV